MYVMLLSRRRLPSLVPRLFLPPVFDRLHYAETEGKGLGERVTCVMSGRREVARCPIIVTHKPCVDLNLPNSKLY